MMYINVEELQLHREIKGRVKYGELLSQYTSLRVGGPSLVMVFPEDVEDLKTVLSFSANYKLPYFILGGGTNLLFRDEGFEGTVINLRESFKSVDFSGDEVTTGSGVYLQHFIEIALNAGFGGIEYLAGIPGTLGGGVKINCGTPSRGIGDRVIDVEYMKKDGSIVNFKTSKKSFRYRESDIPDECPIISITMKMEKKNRDKIKEEIEENIKVKREHQPMIYSSAGCIFKNPPDDSAGRLIEAAGLKGLRVGDAVISSLHANFIINSGNAKAVEILELMDIVINKIRETNNITLIPEIQVVGLK